MGLADELKRLSPEAVERAAAYWLQQTDADAASYLAQKQRQYPILDHLVSLTRVLHQRGQSIDRFASWLQAFQFLITAAEDPFDYDTFISYSSLDHKVANELKDDLEAAGLKCFLAEKDISAGSDWERMIHAAMKASRRVVILITPNSKDKPWVLLEAGAAWALEKRVFPAVMFVHADELIEPLRKVQARNIESITDRRQFIDELTRA